MRGASIFRLFFTIAAIALSQPAGTGAISGTLVDAQSGDPVRKAVVTLNWHGTPRAWATTRTDGSGAFRFEGLPAGNYDLRAAKSGSGVAVYGATNSRETGKTITLADGETRSGVQLRFIHTISISGRVTDRNGDPVEGVRVEVQRAGRNFGNRILVNGAPPATTDDRGEYHISNITPGQYYLFAEASNFRMGPRQFSPGQPSEDQPPDMLVSQYFGGATDSKDATMLTVKDGDTLRGMDFTLLSQHAVMIRGRIAGVPASPSPPPDEIHDDVVGNLRGRPIRRFSGAEGFVNVSVSPVSGMMWSTGGGAQPPDYNFDLGWLPPGEYRVRASIQVDGKTYSTARVVDTRAGSTDLVLTLAPAVDLKGRVRFEGQSDSKPKFTVTLTHAGGNGGGMPQDRPSAQAGDDGSFTLAGVTADEWNLDVPQLGRGEYLKSVRYGDQDGLFRAIEIKPGSDATLDIVVSTHTAKVRGDVDSAGGDPARAAVVFAPVGRFHDLARYYYGILASDEGKFRMVGLAPGKYKVFAVEKLEVAAFRNVEAADQVLALFPDLVQEVELGENVDLEVKPKLIPQERAREILP